MENIEEEDDQSLSMLTFINDLVILIIGRHIESKSPYSSITYFIDEATKLQKWLDDVYKTIVPILTILSDFLRMKCFVIINLDAKFLE